MLVHMPVNLPADSIIRIRQADYFFRVIMKRPKPLRPQRDLGHHREVVGREPESALVEVGVR